MDENTTQEMTLECWLLYWLASYVKPTTKPAGYQHYVDNCEKHIIPKLGSLNLHQLTPRILQRFFNEEGCMGNLRNNGPLAPKSIRNMRVVLNVALKQAMSEEHISSNPVPLTAIKSVKHKAVEILTNETQAVLEQHLFSNNHLYNAGILISLYTGMRLGEVCALKWKNYNPTTNMLHIEQTVKRLPVQGGVSKTQLVFGDTKTSSSNRKLFMPPVLQEILKVQKLRFEQLCGSVGDNDFIVFSSVGGIVDPDNLSHFFARMLRKLDLSHIKFHAIRHTFATRAIENGVDIATVAGLLGHSDVTTTTHYYVHPREEAMKNAMANMTPVTVSNNKNIA